MMLGKKVAGVLGNALKPALMPKRDFAQVGLVISTPPRVKCSLGEKCLHAGFMLFVWLTPVAYFTTQLKVWRREYISS